MTRFVIAGFFVVPVVIALLLLTGIGTEGQVDTASQLPSGNWTFSAQPYVGPGYDSRPVVVISVSTDLKKGLTVADVGLKNTSSKPVAGVKLSWFLSTEQDPDSVLLSGETPLVAISGGIPAGKRRLLTFPVTSFAKIHRPLLHGMTLSGDFRMEVAVSEILYEDGSTAAIKNSDN